MMRATTVCHRVGQPPRSLQLAFTDDELEKLIGAKHIPIKQVAWRQDRRMTVVRETGNTFSIWIGPDEKYLISPAPNEKRGGHGGGQIKITGLPELGIQDQCQVRALGVALSFLEDANPTFCLPRQFLVDDVGDESTTDLFNEVKVVNAVPRKAVTDSIDELRVAVGLVNDALVTIDDEVSFEFNKGQRRLSAKVVKNIM